jgi:hypothetical protein
MKRTKLMLAIALLAPAHAVVPTAAAAPTPLPKICVDGPAPSTCQLPSGGKRYGRTVLEIHPYDNLPYPSVIPPNP